MRLIELKITISQGDFNQINWELVLFADKFIPLHCSYVSAACVPLKYRGTKNTSPFPNDGNFKGTVKINITWVERTDEITLHADPALEIVETLVTQFAPDDET